MSDGHINSEGIEETLKNIQKSRSSECNRLAHQVDFYYLNH